MIIMKVGDRYIVLQDFYHDDLKFHKGSRFTIKSYYPERGVAILYLDYTKDQYYRESKGWATPEYLIRDYCEKLP